jgi:hypothetical protein
MSLPIPAPSAGVALASANDGKPAGRSDAAGKAFEPRASDVPAAMEPDSPSNSADTVSAGTSAIPRLGADSTSAPRSVV